MHRGFASLGALLLVLVVVLMVLGGMRRSGRRSRGVLVVSVTLSLALSLSLSLSLTLSLTLTLSLSLSPRGLDGGLEAERAAPGRGRDVHRRGREELGRGGGRERRAAGRGPPGGCGRMPRRVERAAEHDPPGRRRAILVGRRGSLELGLGGFRERFHRRGDPRVPLAHGGDTVVFHPVVVLELGRGI